MPHLPMTGSQKVRPDPGRMVAIGFGLERIGILALNRPRAALLFVILASIVSILCAAFLRFDDDIVATYRSTHPAYLEYSRFVAETGTTGDDILIIVNSLSPLTAANYGRLLDLHLDLTLVENVQAVFSPFSLTAINPEDGAAEPLMPANITDPELPSILQAVRNAQYGPARMLSEDDRALLMIVMTGADPADRIDQRHLVDNIDAVVAQYHSESVPIVAIGQQKLRFEISDAIRRDQIVFNGGGAVLALILGLVIFRDWRLTIIAFTPAGFSLLWTIGFAGAVGIPITVTTNIVPVLVLVIAFADCLHLTLGLARSDKTLPLGKRISDQVCKIGPACALTSLTTGFSILTLALSGYSALIELAIFGGAAVLIAFIGTIVVFPLVSKLAFTQESSGRSKTELIAGLRVPKRMKYFVLLNPVKLTAVGLITLVGGLAATYGLRPHFTIYENLPRQSQTRQASIEAEGLFGGAFNVWVETRTRDGAPISSPAGWAHLQRLHEALEGAGRKRMVMSLVTVAGVLDQPGGLSKSVDLKELAAPLTARFGALEGDRTRLAVMVPDPLFSQQGRSTFDRLHSAASEAGASEIVGTPVLARFIGTDMVSALFLSVLAAAILSIGMVALAFRRLALVPAVSLSNMLPVLLAGASLSVLSGGKATIPAGLAMTVAFGIAVDDTIHFLNSVRLEQASGRSLPTAVSKSVSNVGQVMIVTTLILTAGTGLTVFSQFDTVRLFGSLMMLILLIALAADLVFLPASILTLYGLRRNLRRITEFP